MHSAQIKQNAIELRKKGYSYGEISKKLSIAKSSAFLWASNIPLDVRATEILRIKTESTLFKARHVLKKRKFEIIQDIKKQALKSVIEIDINKDVERLLCSLLFWAEGAKDLRHVRFSNSDPKMIRVFLYLLRNNFNIDESKLRVVLHLHEYHNEEEQKIFWSEITSIPLTKFNKVWRKPHTGLRKRPGYKGCVDLRYYNHTVAQELEATYNAFAKLVVGASFNGRTLLSKSKNTGSIPVAPAS